MRGIRTCDPNNQEAADLCLTPHGHGIGKNNSSRDEIYEMNSRYTLTGHKTNTETAKELNITLVPDKIQGYKRKWIQDVNRIPRNRLPRLIKLHSKR
jgi:hypothetical protein